MLLTWRAFGPLLAARPGIGRAEVETLRCVRLVHLWEMWSGFRPRCERLLAACKALGRGVQGADLEHSEARSIVQELFLLLLKRSR